MGETGRRVLSLFVKAAATSLLAGAPSAFSDPGGDIMTACSGIDADLVSLFLPTLAVET